MAMLNTFESFEDIEWTPQARGYDRRHRVKPWRDWDWSNHSTPIVTFWLKRENHVGRPWEEHLLVGEDGDLVYRPQKADGYLGRLGRLYGSYLDRCYDWDYLGMTLSTSYHRRELHFEYTFKPGASPRRSPLVWALTRLDERVVRGTFRVSQFCQVPLPALKPEITEDAKRRNKIWRQMLAVQEEQAIRFFSETKPGRLINKKGLDPENRYLPPGYAVDEGEDVFEDDDETAPRRRVQQQPQPVPAAAPPNLETVMSNLAQALVQTNQLLLSVHGQSQGPVNSEGNQ
jgi:hypothetical protein